MDKALPEYNDDCLQSCHSHHELNVEERVKDGRQECLGDVATHASGKELGNIIDLDVRGQLRTEISSCSCVSQIGYSSTLWEKLPTIDCM